MIDSVVDRHVGARSRTRASPCQRRRAGCALNPRGPSIGPKQGSLQRERTTRAARLGGNLNEASCEDTRGPIAQLSHPACIVSRLRCTRTTERNCSAAVQLQSPGGPAFFFGADAETAKRIFCHRFTRMKHGQRRVFPSVSVLQRTRSDGQAFQIRVNLWLTLHRNFVASKPFAW